MTEWMKVMLEEIERKRAEQQQALAEEQLRAAQADVSMPDHTRA